MEFPLPRVVGRTGKGELTPKKGSLERLPDGSDDGGIWRQQQVRRRAALSCCSSLLQVRNVKFLHHQDMERWKQLSDYARSHWLSG